MSFLAKREYETYQGGRNASLWVTAGIYAALVGALAAYGYVRAGASLELTIGAGVLLFAFIGWAQASLSNGFHEAAHHNLFEGQNDRVAAILTGYPVFFTLGYRTTHMQHHLKFGDPELDPDFATFHPFPRTRWRLLQRLVWMGSGLAAGLQLMHRNLRPQSKSSKGGASKADFVGLVVVQASIFGAFALTLGPLEYLLFWILPLGTVAKLCKSTRAFCEHGSPDRPYVLRTITGKPWQTNTLGMYGFHFHGEHHLYPWAPYARLDALFKRHQEALADPFYRAQIAAEYEWFDGGYLRLLVKWFRELPWSLPAEAEEVRAS